MKRCAARFGLTTLALALRLSSWRLAESIHRNRRVLNADDFEMLRLRGRVKLHAVASSGLHERISERRPPTDVAAIQVHFVGADNRYDMFEAASVLVGHGCTEEDARRG